MKEVNESPGHLKNAVKQTLAKVGHNDRPYVIPAIKQTVTKVDANGQLPVVKGLLLGNHSPLGTKITPHHFGKPHPEPTGHDKGPERSSKRPDTSNSLFTMRYFNAERDLPIVYTDQYNISALGLELLHQFDTKKYGKIALYLSDEFRDTPFVRKVHQDVDAQDVDCDERALHYLRPNRPVTKKELEIHHTAEFVERIHGEKSLAARITEIWALNLLPAATIESRLLTPIKWQVAGTIFATYLAMQHGWSINLGGGFHQCSANQGETFCMFSDVFVAIRHVWQRHPLQKFMIIDLDAHQGLGLERDILELEPKRRRMVFMVDILNNAIQPPDEHADKGIDVRVELGHFTGDDTYLKRLGEALSSAFEKFKPTVVIYIAGQDVLREDQLGLLNLSDAGLKKRDELVFASAVERSCPIVMLLGGGYLDRGARVQADSIRNLFAKGLIWGGHRSGARSLSRPRLGQAATKTETSFKMDPNKPAGAAVKSTFSQTSLKQAPPVRRLAESIRTARVESKFLLKKAAVNQPDKSDSVEKRDQS